MFFLKDIPIASISVSASDSLSVLFLFDTVFVYSIACIAFGHLIQLRSVLYMKSHVTSDAQTYNPNSEKVGMLWKL